MACGNFVPGGDLAGEDFDLYAAGLDSTSLRTMLAFLKDREWGMGVTDIRQAFTLAPWTGAPVALKPPQIAIDWGLVQPEEYWLVKKSIYGLRGITGYAVFFPG